MFITFLFAIFVNYIEDFFCVHRAEGVDITKLKLFLLLYADNLTIFPETAEGLQKG